MTVDRGVPRMAVAGLAFATGMAFAAAAWAQGEWKAPPVAHVPVPTCGRGRAAARLRHPTPDSAANSRCQTEAVISLVNNNGAVARIDASSSPPYNPAMFSRLAVHARLV